MDYAYGLVLLKLLRYKDAQSQFLTATKRPGTPYFPAWRALIWTHFSGKEYEAGYDRLLEYTKLVLKSNEIEDRQRRDAVEWVGRVMAALELILESAQKREAWIQIDKNLAVLFDPTLLEVYGEGKEDAYTRHSFLEDELRDAQDKAKERKALELEKKQNRLGKAIDSAKEKRDSLKKSAEEMKDEFNENTAAFKKQSERFEKDYSFLQRRGTTLMASMATIDAEVNVLQQRTVRMGNAQNLSNQLSLLQTQRLAADLEFQRMVAAAQDLSARAQQLFADRAEYVRQYEKATGDMVSEDAGLEKWKERATKQAEELKVAKEPKAHAAAKVQPPKTFRTYVDFDLLLERNKVLDSFGVTPGEK